MSYTADGHRSSVLDRNKREEQEENERTEFSSFINELPESREHRPVMHHTPWWKREKR